MKTICISGGFDPLHIGHIHLIEHAAQYGKVIVILNSDEWLIRKKGYKFMEWNHRAGILAALRDVSMVVEVNDIDDTVCQALMAIRPDYFANGGDRKEDNIPELKTCTDFKIKPLFDIGGNKKESSSELVRSAHVH